jgi:hypothetical protein
MTIKTSIPKAARHKKIPYKLYGNIVSALRHGISALDGNSGAVPLPGVPPDEVHIL